MAFEALRFIHAAGVMADHQVREIGSCSDEIRSELIDATLTAFERIIEACVEHEVDFLLLTGDTFCEADRSLRARVAIRDGFECLGEAGIDVFVVPGPNDPPAAWSSIPGLPDNVSIFKPEVDEPTAVMRNGNVLATLQACIHRSSSDEVRSEEASSLGQSRIGPFRIGVIPPFATSGPTPDESVVETWLSQHRVDYLAVPCPFSRLTATRMEQLAHCPGPATSISKADVGPLGCSLVSVEARSSISTDLIVASSLRREKINITIGETASWDQLIGAMRGYVESLPGLDRTSVLMLDWQLTGYGELFDSLKNEESEQELFELLEADTSLADSLQLMHSLTLIPDASNETGPDGGYGTDSADSDWSEDDELTEDTLEEAQEAPVNPLLASFLRRLDQEHSVASSVSRILRSSDDGDSEAPWLARLESLADRVSREKVKENGRDYATIWFSSSQDSNQE